ncbi:toxin-antitoxin system YwqK family antitoxin [Pontibacter anaerobius]|uniref:TonB C-terminal domain-containing protein n=1 Tax=Pontibacter anaerobius TaxID=2993940 RepID=A0ABT3RAZ8_9BACT|nr:hypothetical protein [Pontibacter anaerobius]MCX2738609.1 hypothetical protein [Pontibacter anaerobius]
MRTILLCISFLLFALSAFAQEPLQRRISLKNFGNDSLHIPFNAAYFMVEDSCAQITRQVKLNTKERFFYGLFKDVLTQSPEVVVAEGNYNSDGLKDGDFTSTYLDGVLQARGSFKAGQLDGDWQIFYPSGKPKLTFNATQDAITLKDAWDENGTKVVENGTGKYEVRLSLVTWKGKLLNGKPDGTWIATSPQDRSNRVLSSERFKKGEFVSGTSPIGKYTDESRIIWFNLSDLPFLNAEKMAIASELCNASPRTFRKIVGVNYRNGVEAYKEEIRRVISEYLSTVDLKPYDDVLHIEGEVSEDGRLMNLRHKNAFNDRIATGLERVLGRLPLLQPAVVDGKPIKQVFRITFKFYQGMYSFNYQFLPIRLDKQNM